MEWGGPLFVIAIIAVSIGGWLINNWIRARQRLSARERVGRHERQDG